MGHSYPKESIYQLYWHGPTALKKLREEEKDYTDTLSLYAKYQDHPLYGRKVLTYIGKAVDQTVLKRLSQHDLEGEMIYVATIYEFTSWSDDASNYAKDFKDQNVVRHREGDADVISRIEELLIYALWPAGNKRNKSSAKNSWEFRLFNTGNLGDLPPEVSGYYALENAPPP